MSTRWTKTTAGELDVKYVDIVTYRSAFSIVSESASLHSKLRINVDITVAMRCQCKYSDCSSTNSTHSWLAEEGAVIFNLCLHLQLLVQMCWIWQRPWLPRMV